MAIYPQVSSTCTRCLTMWKKVPLEEWQCPTIRSYWETVLDTLNDLGDWSIQPDPYTILLSIMDDIVASRYMKLLLFYALYYARRERLLRWKQPTSPTLANWVSAVNSVLPLYTLTYVSRNCPKTFDKVWSTWIDAHGPVESLDE